MQTASMRAIVLRKFAYGDFDLVVRLFTRRRGKQAAIAKHARKSRRRFAGALEPFAALSVVLRSGRARGGMPLLQEVAVHKGREAIRQDYGRTAHASYWTELVDIWAEDGAPQPAVYDLLDFCLDKLADGAVDAETLGIFFQIRFIAAAGMGPALDRCCRCHGPLDRPGPGRLAADPAAGGVTCSCCAAHGPLEIDPGTLRQLQWMDRQAPDKALRLRLSSAAIGQATAFLEDFVPYHLGRRPKSLAVLRQLRSPALTQEA